MGRERSRQFGPKDPVRVGCYDNPKASVMKIVHISDTHLQHDTYLDIIPDGDLLIHTGDFSHLNFLRYIRREHDMKQTMRSIDKFFSKLPHKHKIFIAGNHEITLDSFSRETIQKYLPHGIYLCDSYAIIDGVKIYGVPCTNIRAKSYARAYAVPNEELINHWRKIDDDIDILLTHMPPYGLQDSHGGCRDLREEVLGRIRPKVHMFGHMHSGNGITIHDGTCFSNAAMHTIPSPNVIHLYYEKTEGADDDVKIYCKEELAGESIEPIGRDATGCLIM